MNQYQYHGNQGLYKHEQPLTPISTLTSHYQDSPAQSHVLPPLHAPASAGAPGSFAANGYRPSHASRLPHSPDTPAHDHHMSHMPAAEPHTSYAPITHGFPNSSSGYGSLGGGHHHQQQQPQNGGMSNGSGGQYSQQVPGVSLPQINANSYGGAVDYRQQNGMPSYPYPSQHQMPQQQQQPPPQSQPQQQMPLPSAQDARRELPVVGSQARRDILPTSAGTAPAQGPPTDAAAVRGGAPVNRNSENKYPCSYCNKTYLHLKHLKRHHLRRKSS